MRSAGAEPYGESGSQSIAGSGARIAREIRGHGPISFARFMDLALYAPEGGYYSRPGREVGRRGDFFTSVSAGPLFGKLLADHLAAWRGTAAGPWRILELGAHDGTLARDILETLHAEHPACLDGLTYTIIEPLPALAARQRETLADFGDAVRIAGDAAELAPMPTFLLGNELIDALPCHLVESTGSGWRELGVAIDERGAFIWHPLGPAEEIAAALPVRPAGYRTEVRPHLAAFLAPLARLLDGGRMLWIDYGFDRSDYYVETRREGTLRTYRAHRAGDDPLDAPGLRDLTAHVEFTALREAIEACGGEVAGFETQACFLTRLARPWLLSREGRTDPSTMKLLRNFQTLTHPGQLGGRFHVMEAVWPEKSLSG